MPFWKNSSATATKELFEAARCNDTAKVKALIADGADINAKDGTGKTAFFRAIEEGHTGVVNTFIAAGADVNARDHLGYTALGRAVSKRRVPVIEALLVAGADPNAKDTHWGWTALHHAADLDNADAVKVLVRGGADPFVKDVTGQTPLQSRSFHHNVAESLRAAEEQHSRTQNLLRWERSGFPRKWVDDHHGQWGHSDWLALLESLKRTAFWPMEAEAIGRALEEQKKARHQAAALSREHDKPVQGAAEARKKLESREPAKGAGNVPMKRLKQNEGDKPIEINPFRITFAFLVATPSDYQRYGTRLGDSILELLTFCQPAVWQVISAADVSIDPVLKTIKNCTLMSEANDVGFPHLNPDGFHKELQKLGLSSSDSLVINLAVNSYDGGRTKTNLLVGFAFRDKEQCCYCPLRKGCAVPGVKILESEPGHVTVVGDVLGLYRSR